MEPCGTYDVTYQQRMAVVHTKLQWFMLISGIVILFCLPLFVNDYILNFLTIVGITLIAVHGLNIVTGCCGQINLGQSAFIGVGAYTSAILMCQGIPFLAASLSGGIFAGAIGVLFGLPSFRLKGFYLAMSTFAAQFIIPYVILRLPQLTGGAFGLTVPVASIAGKAFTTMQDKYFLVIAIAIIVTFVTKNLLRTMPGRAFVAIRDNDLAAKGMGINIIKIKLLAFFICCFFAGIAGSLWACYRGSLNAEEFSLMWSIWLLGMVIIGGMGSTLGAILGTVFIKGLDEGVLIIGGFLARSVPVVGISMASFVGSIIFGMAILLFLIFEPRGLAHRWEVFKNSYRLFPFPY